MSYLNKKGNQKDKEKVLLYNISQVFLYFKGQNKEDFLSFTKEKKNKYSSLNIIGMLSAKHNSYANFSLKDQELFFEMSKYFSSELAIPNSKNELFQNRYPFLFAAFAHFKDKREKSISFTSNFYALNNDTKDLEIVPFSISKFTNVEYIKLIDPLGYKSSFSLDLNIIDKEINYLKEDISQSLKNINHYSKTFEYFQRMLSIELDNFENLKLRLKSYLSSKSS